MAELTPAAQAYIKEYGFMPCNWEELERYAAFNFGFSAGVRFERQGQRIKNFIDRA